MNTKTHRLICLFLLVLYIQGCLDYSKQDYLADYQKFVFEVKENWEVYNENDWVELDGRNQEFSKMKYDKYQSELSPSEKLRIRRFDFAYHFYRGDMTASMLLSQDYATIFGDLSKELLSIYKELNEFKHDIRTEYLTTLVDRMLMENKKTSP